VNLDGVQDASDLDALNHSLNSINAAFNFNGDSAVNAADVDSLLTSAFGTVRGDVNLDHAVGFSDLVTLAQNYNTLGAGHWSTGDFNGDSNVDFSDLVVIAQNYGFGTPGLSTANFQADWALAQSFVPEPTTLGAAAAAAGAAATRRRKE
jgi:hypothetical protein